jgi:hypothetical protein
MATVFALVFLFGFVLGIVGILNPAWVKMADRKKSSAYYFGASFVALILFSVTVPEKDSVAGPDAGAVPDEARTMPDDQRRFVEVVSGFIKEFHKSKNELQESVLREDRKRALIKVMPSLYVNGWFGRISTLETTGDGSAILSVSISPSISIQTWNNSISDVIDNTLISKNSDLYSKLINCEEGNEILFDGGFFSSEEDYVQETSITIRGSMLSPEFLFRFSSINCY